MYQEAMPWVPEVFFSSAARLQTVSLLSLSVERNARDTLMTTCETEGTRRERHDKALVSGVLQLCRSTLARARALPLLNLMKKRGCSQSRVQRYSLTFPKQKQVISCLICGTKWNKKRQNKTLCQVHLTLSKTETFRTGTNCPS